MENLTRMDDFMIIFSAFFKDRIYHLKNSSIINLFIRAFLLENSFFYCFNSSFLTSSMALLFFEFEKVYYSKSFAFM